MSLSWHISEESSFFDVGWLCVHISHLVALRQSTVYVRYIEH